MPDHTPAEAVIENNVAPTCETAGHYDSVVYCSVCHAELSRETVTVPATGHAYGEPTYVWAEDNSTVTATAVCANDETHVITETVNTTYEVTTPPTATEDGLGTWTAVFENELFQPQTKTEVLPATGPVEPQLAEDLDLREALKIGAKTVVAYGVRRSAVEKYETCYVELRTTDINGNDITLRYGTGQENELEDIGTARLLMNYTGFLACEMATEYTVQAFAVDAEGNQFYGPEYQSSIKQYLSEKLMDSTNSTAELKRLCADMLNYGTEAQTYFGYKVNEPINVFEDQAIMDAIAANMTTELAATEDRVTVAGAQSATLRFALNLRYQVETTVQATISNATGPKLVVRNHSDGTVVDTLNTANVSGSKWNAVFMKVAAANMRTLYDFVMEDNGEAVTKTTTWSVAAYAEDIRATAPTSNLSKMLDAMLIYGDAAAAYLKPNS
jgi:hypothetical protein